MSRTFLDALKSYKYDFRLLRKQRASPSWHRLADSLLPTHPRAAAETRIYYALLRTHPWGELESNMFKNLSGKSFIALLVWMLIFNFVLYALVYSFAYEGSVSWTGVGNAIGGAFGSLQSFGLFLVGVLVLVVLALITLWLRRWAVALIIWAIVLIVVGAFFGSSLTKTFSFILNFGPILLIIVFTAVEVAILKPVFNRSRV